MKTAGWKCSLSAMLTSLPLDFDAAVNEAKAIGFTHVDVVGLVDRPHAHREALAESGLLVACGAIGRGLPEGHSLDALSPVTRRATVEEMKRQIADVALLGATHCYVVPEMDGSPMGLARFSEACLMLADFARQRMVRLCIEHCPGKALPSATSALELLEGLGNESIGLLLDVGHCLITREDPIEIVRRAGSRLGYVHLNDNDGVSDLHWPLLTGRLTEATLTATLSALHARGFDGGLALELQATNAEPGKALKEGKELVERLTSSAVHPPRPS